MPETRVSLSLGVWLALAAAVLFGISAPLAKHLVETASPQLVAGLLYSGSGIGLGVLSIIRRSSRSTRGGLTRKDWPWLAGAIASGGVIAPLLLLTGLSHTAASTASLLLNLEGVFTAVIAWTLFHENVDRRIALGMLCIVAGGIVLSWNGQVSIGGIRGPFAVAAACLCWGIDNNLTQKVSASDPFRIAMLKGLIAGAVNVAIALSLGAHFPSSARTGGALLLGFFSYGLSLVLFVAALSRLGTARTSAYFSIGPFVGAFASLIIWREPVTLLFGVSALLMAAGLLLHFTERHQHMHKHERMEHAHSHVHDEHHRHSHSPDDPPGEPHTHAHVHEPLEHSHLHFPDIHHRHTH